jgi:catechol 2,3-dioxygenase-like lactoylglutathione lyase family enzyme
MGVQLNHTIVWCRAKQKSAAFLTEILGLPPAKPFGPMLVVPLENGISVDFYDQPGEINRHFGGRGMYFDDPGGHLLEVITRPHVIE